MKPRFTGLGSLALLLLISSTPLLQSQTTAIETGAAGPYYDLAREVTLKATVSTVLPRPAPGMIMGSHLLLATASGEVDASLGRFGLQGTGALSVAAGQQVEVTGVLKTLMDKQVLIARTVKAGRQIYTMRNEHGIQISPQARARARTATQKEDSR